jgi:dUTP pyrophosphatase
MYNNEEQVRQAARDFRMLRGVATDVLRVKRLTATAQLPTYGSAGAAGLDLYVDFGSAPGDAHTADERFSVTEDFSILKPGQRRLLKTGISIAVPPGHYGRVAPRSGLASKQGIDVLAGVIDEDYRGEVGVILINLGATDVRIAHGDRVAQLIIEQYTPVLVVDSSSLEDTNRGAGAFGSTGK